MSAPRHELEIGKLPHKPHKSQLKHSNTILTDPQSSFEDSRVTLLLFEKYRIVEITRFCAIFACQVLAILEV